MIVIARQATRMGNLVFSIQQVREHGKNLRPIAAIVMTTQPPSLIAIASWNQVYFYARVFRSQRALGLPFVNIRTTS